MRNLMITAGLALTVVAGASAPAQARNYCEQQKHEDRTTGTILGAGVGALAGGLIGGNVAGALVGGAVGAVGGNAIAASRDPKCDRYYARQGYYWDSQYGAYRSRDRQYRNGGYNNNGYNNGAYTGNGYNNGAGYNNGYNNNGYNNNGYNNGGQGYYPR